MMTIYTGREGQIEWELNRRTRILNLWGDGPIPEFSPFHGDLPAWTPLRDRIQEVRMGHGITRIGDYALYPYDHGIYADIRAPLCRVVFPLSLESIGRSAFRANTHLSVIDLYGLENLRVIEENAFASCFRARAVDLGGCVSLERIDPRAFWGCDELAYIDLEGCASLSAKELKALRQETPSHVPIIMPDGRVSCGMGLTDCEELECRVLLKGGGQDLPIR